MIRKIALAVLLLAGAALIIVLTVVPGVMERRMNRVLAEPPYDTAVPAEVRAVHDRLSLVDAHADTLLWQRDITKRSERGHVDLPRLLQGGVTLQIFSAVTYAPGGQNYERNAKQNDQLTLLMMAQARAPSAWFSEKGRALSQARALHRTAAADPRLMLIKTRQDLADLLAARKQGQAIVGGLLALEGAHAIEGQLSSLETLYEAGYRMVGLTHFFDNEVAGSAHGLTKGGLTDLGRDLVAWAENRGMIIDLAHASPTTIDQVLALADRPVVVSHTGVKGTCDNVRNLSDAHIKGIAATGGVVSIGYWDQAVCDASAAGVVSAMLYVRDLVGPEHVGLGSDFDGAVMPPFDTTGLIRITQELMARGVPEAEIRQMTGGAMLAVLARTLPDETADPGAAPAAASSPPS
ncbi:MAG: dipeptidase [Rhodothalassiaceae bacterium]